MAALPANLKKLFARTKLVVLPEDYLLISLPADARPIPGEWYRPATTRFGAFIREPKEITLIVTRRKWLRMQNVFKQHEVSGPMKVITFDIKLSLAVYGYLAALSRVIADDKISLVPISSFHRDHILVAKQDLPRTVRVLRQFLQSCKRA